MVKKQTISTLQKATKVAKPMGRPTFVPTDHDRKQVEAMSGYGVPIHQIASLVQKGIDVNTLNKYFAEQLITGKAKANSKVGQRLFAKATEGDVASMIWWSKTQMRWSEPRREESEPGSTADIAQQMRDLADRLPV